MIEASRIAIRNIAVQLAREYGHSLSNTRAATEIGYVDAGLTISQPRIDNRPQPAVVLCQGGLPVDLRITCRAASDSLGFRFRYDRTDSYHSWRDLAEDFTRICKFAGTCQLVSRLQLPLGPGGACTLLFSLNIMLNRIPEGAFEA